MKILLNPPHLQILSPTTTDSFRVESNETQPLPIGIIMLWYLDQMKTTHMKILSFT